MTPQHQNIIRTPKDADHPFLAISRALAQDTRLSYEARGVMLYLLSKPNDWQVRPADIEQDRCKREKVYRILNELKCHGYLVRDRQRDASGKIEWLPYRVVEQPQLHTEEPHAEKPYMVAPSVAIPHQDAEYTNPPHAEKPYTVKQHVVSAEIRRPDAVEGGMKEIPPHAALPYTVFQHVYIVESKDNREEEEEEEEERTGHVVANSAPLIAAAAALCNYPDRMTSNQASKLSTLVMFLTANGITTERLAPFAAWWRKESWIGRKAAKENRKPSPPTPDQVISLWPEFDVVRPMPLAPSGPDRIRRQSTPEEQRAALAAARNGRQP